MKKLEGVIEVQQFDRETLEAVFSLADKMEVVSVANSLRGKIMCTLFYEPSTRTRMSFEAAMKRLGGEVISTENAREFSSVAKGESLEDTIKVISGYVDVIILRYDQEGGAKRAQNFSVVPIINAGDGTGQHPTQALLDIYTIRKFFGDVSKLKIAMVGDLTNGRTVRSLCYLMAKHYPPNLIYFVSPVWTRMKDDIKTYLDGYGVKWVEEDDLNHILPELDVIYQTRVQKERFQDDRSVYEQVMRDSEKLIINRDSLRRMKSEAIIMHPLPRISEISYEVDKDKRAIYFKQAQFGLYVRMALLKMILVGY